MKKILQALDTASTKPVEGSGAMAKFVRVVKEANLNQPAVLPTAPKFSITQTSYDSLNEPPDFTVTNIEQGSEVASFNSEQEARAYVAQQDPAGAPQTTLHQMQSTTTAPEANPTAVPQEPVAEEFGMRKLLAIISEGPTNGPEYEYQLKALQNLLTAEQEPWKQNLTKWRINNLQTNGVTSFKTDYSKNAAGVTIPTKVVGSDAWVKANPNLLKKLPRECQPPIAIHEGANPHKVALPVQMAMQHYQKVEKAAIRKDRLIDKYFTEADAAITQRKAEKRAVINQYASVIAERVMMKESKLDERSTSEKQARTMAAAAHNPEFAKKVGIKTSVAKEFNQKDKGTALLSNAMKGKKKKVKEAGEAGWGRSGMAGVGLQSIDELSTELLGKYKKAAGADAKKADSEGNYKRGDKRFSGIVKATKKQFANDEKGVAEGLEQLLSLRNKIDEAIQKLNKSNRNLK